jgi:MFS family permease
VIRSSATRLAEAGRSLRAVVSNPQLRRVEAARAAIALAIGMYGVVFIVLAYRAGGASAVGALAVVRMLTTAVASPFGAMLGDRLPRHRVMYAADLFRAAVLLAIALAAVGDPPALAVFLTAAGTAAAGTVSAPARAALIPSLARTPDELAAANVLASTSEGISAFAGPSIGGLLLAFAGLETALLGAASACLVSALLVSRLAADENRAEAARRAREGRFHGATAGFQLLTRESGVRVLAAVYVAQTLATGVLGVVVVVAVIELLELGEAGVGFASSVMAVGGLLGAVAALMVVGGRGLARGLVGASMLWGSAVALIASWPEPWFALVLFGVVGLADTIVDVCGVTLLQRTVPEEVLSRVFGALAAILFAVAALGALIAPLLLEVLGTRGALLATGGMLVPMALLAWPKLRRLETLPAPSALASIASIPFFAPLPEATLERLAARAARVHVAAGEPVFEQGDRGDRFYVVEGGEALVMVDGLEAARARRGDFFGEIALLRDVPRTASVIAKEDLELWSIERADFLETLTVHPASLEAADTTAGARLRQALPVDLA